MTSLFIVVASSSSSSSSSRAWDVARHVWSEWPPGSDVAVTTAAATAPVFRRAAREQLPASSPNQQQPVRVTAAEVLERAVGVVASECGIDQATQVVLIVDAAVVSEPLGDAAVASLAASARIHVIALGPAAPSQSVAEVKSDSETLSSTLVSASSRTFGLHLSGEDAGIAKVFLRYFEPLWRQEITVTLGNQFGRVIVSPPHQLVHRRSLFNDPPAEFVWTTWSILGFLPLAHVHQMPVLSRHVMTTATNDRSGSTPGSTAVLLTLLNAGLSKEPKRVAVLQMDENRFGYVAADGNHLNVALLAPGATSNWRDAFTSMPAKGPYPGAVPPNVPLATHDASALGIDVAKSYASALSSSKGGGKDAENEGEPGVIVQGCHQVMFLSKDAIQASLLRIAKHCAKLPNKRHALVDEINRLRGLALLYRAYDLLTTAVLQQLHTCLASMGEDSIGHPIVHAIISYVDTRQFLTAPLQARYLPSVGRAADDVATADPATKSGRSTLMKLLN